MTASAATAPLAAFVRPTVSTPVAIVIAPRLPQWRPAKKVPGGLLLIQMDRVPARATIAYVKRSIGGLLGGDAVQLV